MKLLIALFITCSMFAQETGDLRYTDSLEIFLDGEIKGWFNFDSLYQTRSDDGYVYLGNMAVINLDIIQSERKRFQVFMEEYNGWVLLPTHDYKCERMLEAAEQEIQRLKLIIENKK